MKKLTDEKISEEMARNLLQDVNGPEETKQRIIERWRAAGLLEPEEDELEMARVAWEKRKAAFITADGQLTSNVACEYIKQLLAEIKRLKESAWNDADLRAAYEHGYKNGGTTGEILLSFSGWRSSRKKRKDGE